MKIIIAGSRSFSDYDLLKKFVSDIIKTLNEDVEIVSGGAKGTDKLGEKFSREELNKPPTIFPADWKTYGRSAGIKRNIEMGDYADALIAFWDRNSRGTHHMINYMKSKEKIIWIQYFDRGKINESTIPS